MKIKRKIPGRTRLNPAAPWVLRAFWAVVMAGFIAVLLVIAALGPVFRFLERLEAAHGQRDEYDDEDDDGHGGVYPGLIQDRTPSDFAGRYENRATS